MSTKIKITRNRTKNNWVTGTADIDGKEFDFEAKVFDEPSEFGIPTDCFPDGGNVSKLAVKPTSSDWSYSIISYDRGWDIMPEDSPLGYATADELTRSIVNELEKATDSEKPSWAVRR